MRLYHYTSLYSLQKILKDGVLKTTCSNLLKPIKPHFKDGALVDITDSYKPVIWFTTVSDFQKAKGCGIIGGAYDKTEVAIAVEITAQKFYKWTEWAKRNNIEKTWFEALKQTAPLWNTFYVTEKPIIIHPDNPEIIFRPDMYEELKKGLT